MKSAPPQLGVHCFVSNHLERIMNVRTKVPFKHRAEIDRVRQLICEAEEKRREAGDILADLFDREGMRSARGHAIAMSAT